GGLRSVVSVCIGACGHEPELLQPRRLPDRRAYGAPGALRSDYLQFLLWKADQSLPSTTDDPATHDCFGNNRARRTDRCLGSVRRSNRCRFGFEGFDQKKFVDVDDTGESLHLESASAYSV